MTEDAADVIIIEIKCPINVMHLNYPETVPLLLPQSMKKLSSMKLVPGAKKVGDRCFKASVKCWLIRETSSVTLFNIANPTFTLPCCSSSLSSSTALIIYQTVCFTYLSCLEVISFSSVQFSCSVVSDSLRPHALQHASPPCPSPTPGVYSNTCPLSWWCHPAISSFSWL